MTSKSPPHTHAYTNTYTYAHTSTSTYKTKRKEQADIASSFKYTLPHSREPLSRMSHLLCILITGKRTQYMTSS